MQHGIAGAKSPAPLPLHGSSSEDGIAGAKSPAPTPVASLRNLYEARHLVRDSKTVRRELNIPLHLGKEVSHSIRREDAGKRFCRLIGESFLSISSNVFSRSASAFPLMLGQSGAQAPQRS